MFFAAHSGIRFLVVALGAAALLYALFGVVTRRPYDKGMRILGSSFAGSVHLNVVLGIAVLFSGQFTPAIWGHFLMMVLAAVVAQLAPSVMRRRPMQDRTFLPHLVCTALSLALIVAGIMAIGRGVFQSTV